MYNVLIAYHYYDEYPPRPALTDHLRAFEAPGNRCFYLNTVPGPPPRYLRHVRFDLVVFATSYLSARWTHSLFRELMDRTAGLAELGDVRIALPQDEFLNSRILCEFIERFRIDHVFSVAPETEHALIYSGLDNHRAQFHQVLTGYLSDKTVHRVQHLERRAPARTVDVGYRAWNAAPWLGRHGRLKVEVAQRFAEEGPKHGLRTDISTRPEDTLLGDDWFRFLLKCRFTIGVEGGASILDPDGAARARTEAYQAQHPGASFDEIERECFPGLDGLLKLFALSPRHLEACATRTCQVLLEGEFNGVLKPDVHYIPLKRDFSNLEDVLRRMADEPARARMVERAYQDIVASTEYSYRAFADQVVRTVAPLSGPRSGSPRASALEVAVWTWMLVRDRWYWMKLRLHRTLEVPARSWLFGAVSRSRLPVRVKRVILGQRFAGAA